MWSQKGGIDCTFLPEKKRSLDEVEKEHRLWGQVGLGAMLTYWMHGSEQLDVHF